MPEPPLHPDLPCITCVTPTLCRLMAVAVPSHANSSPLQRVMTAAEETSEAQPFDRMLVYAPDAIGLAFCEAHEALVEPLRRWAPVTIDLRSAFPPKTPVCFASMFTGAQPDVHGITSYHRPVLTCGTLFDEMVRANRRPAIVAVENSSIDLIFRNRTMDYFSERYDDEVTERTLELIHGNRHDFILAYHQEYDDALHATSPDSRDGLRAVGNHVSSFVRMALAVRQAWARYNHAVVVAPDHGAHFDLQSGRGTHGEDIPEDMHVRHFYGFRRRSLRAL